MAQGHDVYVTTEILVVPLLFEWLRFKLLIPAHYTSAGADLEVRFNTIRTMEGRVSWNMSDADEDASWRPAREMSEQVPITRPVPLGNSSSGRSDSSTVDDAGPIF